jgi:hypothetical protein
VNNEQHETTKSDDLFGARLDQTIIMKNQLAQFAGAASLGLDR